MPSPPQTTNKAKASSFFNSVQHHAWILGEFSGSVADAVDADEPLSNQDLVSIAKMVRVSLTHMITKVDEYISSETKLPENFQ